MSQYGVSGLKYEPILLRPFGVSAAGDDVRIILGMKYKTNAAHAFNELHNPVQDPLEFPSYILLLRIGTMGTLGVLKVRPQLMDNLNLKGDDAGTEFALSTEGNQMIYTEGTALPDEYKVIYTGGDATGSIPDVPNSNTGAPPVVMWQTEWPIVGGQWGCQVQITVETVEWSMAMYPKFTQL